MQANAVLVALMPSACQQSDLFRFYHISADSCVKVVSKLCQSCVKVCIHELHEYRLLYIWHMILTILVVLSFFLSRYYECFLF